MSYIGLPPKANFTSGLLDRFTSTTGTTVTLTHDISSENDIVVFVNFVKQDSTTYSVGGTGNKTLTLGGTLVSSDIVEVHYLNIVGQTVNPSANSVGSSQLTTDSITGQTAETSIADDDTIIIHDTSASALKKMTKANFTSGIGGTNTPSFFATNSSDQSLSHDSLTKIAFQTERFDTATAFDNSTNYRFTVPSGQAGKYCISYLLNFHQPNNDYQRGIETYIYKNGASLIRNYQYYGLNNDSYFDLMSSGTSCILDLSVNDYLEIYAIHNNASSASINVKDYDDGTFFCGFKLI